MLGERLDQQLGEQVVAAVHVAVERGHRDVEVAGHRAQGDPLDARLLQVGAGGAQDRVGRLLTTSLADGGSHPGSINENTVLDFSSARENTVHTRENSVLVSIVQEPVMVSDRRTAAFSLIASGTLALVASIGL